MPSIKGTQTELNLLKAFAGESQARNRYTYFASVAKKEGFEQISALFIETADNEKEHAKVFFKYLEGGDTEITATYPAGKIGTTAENLLAAAEGELAEWGTLYPEFADDRRVRGLHRRRGLVPRDRQGRGAPRVALSQAARERERLQGLQEGRRRLLEVPQLRLRVRRRRPHRWSARPASIRRRTSSCSADNF